MYVLVHIGKTGKTVAKETNSRPWISLLQGGKCGSVLKGNIKCVLGISIIGHCFWVSSSHNIIIRIIPIKCLHASSTSAQVSTNGSIPKWDHIVAFLRAEYRCKSGSCYR